MDFNKARDDEVAVASDGPYAHHLHLAPDGQPCQQLITQFFTGWYPSCCPTSRVKAMKAKQGPRILYLLKIQVYREL